MSVFYEACEKITAEDSGTLETVLNDFDLAWQHALKSGSNPPSLEDFIVGESPELGLLSTLYLASIDLDRRLRDASDLETLGPSKCAKAEDYLERFARIQADKFATLELICAEFRARYSIGDSKAKADLLARFGGIPELNDALEAAHREVASEFPDRLPEVPGFEVRGEIGRGGRGLVYRAWQPDLKRYVAIKRLRPGLLDSASEKARLRREANSLAKLKHPNVVAIHSVLEHEDELFLVMELVEGNSLHQLIANEDMPINRVVDILGDITHAVEFAHTQGVLHRDLKPANILVDSQWRAKVTDFGMAKNFRNGNETQSLTLTQSEAVLGTPCFMPPEQINSKVGEVGVTADVYSIGATLYQMLTGRPPIKGSTSWETFQLVLESEPVRPRALNPKISRDLETICLRCLEKSPANRYQNAKEIAEDLVRFKKGEAIRARPISVFTRCGRWILRRPREASLWFGIAAALTLLVGVSVFGALAYSRLYRQEQIQRTDVERALEKSEDSRYFGLIQQSLLHYDAENLAEVRTLLDMAIPEDGDVDRRDWEWYYLNGLVDAGVHRTSVGGEEDTWVSAADWSQDGRRWVCGTSVPPYESMIQNAKASVSVRELSSGAEVFSCKVDGNTVDQVAFSPSGNLLAIATHQKDRAHLDGKPDTERAYITEFTRLEVYDLQSRKVVFAQDDLAKEALVVSFSEDEGSIVTLADYELQVWALEGGQLWSKSGVEAFRICSDRIEVEFSENGGTQSLSIDSGEATRERPPSPHHVGRGEFHFFRSIEGYGRTSTPPRMRPTYRVSADGNWACFVEEEAVVIRNRKTGELVNRLAPGSTIFAEFSPQAEHLAIALANGSIEIWDIKTASLLKRLKGHSVRLTQLQFSDSGSWLLSGDGASNVVLWDWADSGKFFGKSSAPSSEHPVEAFAFSRDAAGIVAASLEVEGLTLLGVGTQEKILASIRPVPQIAPGRSAAISKDGSLFAYIAQEDRKRVEFSRLENWGLQGVDLDRPVQFIQVSETGQCVGIAAWERKNTKAEDIHDSRVVVVSSERNEPSFDQVLEDVRVWRIAVCEARQLLAVCKSFPNTSVSSIVDNGRTVIEVWDYSAQVKLWEHALPDDSVLCLGLDFDRQGSTLAAGTLVGQITLFEADTGKALLELEGALENLEDLTFNPAGTRIAAVSRKQLTLWDTKNGTRIMSVAGPITTYDAILNAQARFSPDGKRLLTNHYDATVRVLGK